MPIPNAQSAFIPQDKLTKSLLNQSHRVGGPKAAWFLSLGYDPDDVGQLGSDLIEVVHTSSDFMTIEDTHGTKYVVSGQLRTPRSGIAKFRTVWIEEPGDSKPRFVTAYPDKGRNNE